MSRELRREALQAFCDALDAVAPDAPTLCEGWDAHDLAVHLWVITHDPLSWPGEFLPITPLRRLTRRRARRLRTERPYSALVAALRAGSGAIACMPGDERLEGCRHAIGEYFVHTQDIVRANGIEQRPPALELENALWRRLGVATPVLKWRDHPGLLLTRPDGLTAQATRGRPRTRVSGSPSELMCWVYGRPADVCVERL
ncbi:maleylpyruvate isomerase family mycothiol-dependent enzyme [Mobilicoccus massiliensis]|uniref:maleylpyruvate isomerase family mycothiol-dependent enzyme n=1 Tax=Mobilicoccus massiliensis TaxID=1522310 RepID=UPI000694C8EC|nr:maleylpyruvate isomerase family mycothiol-dependent enzyme [Mobilicoccus massiliensis]